MLYRMASTGRSGPRTSSPFWLGWARRPKDKVEGRSPRNTAPKGGTPIGSVNILPERAQGCLQFSLAFLQGRAVPSWILESGKSSLDFFYPWCKMAALYIACCAARPGTARPCTARQSKATQRSGRLLQEPPHFFLWLRELLPNPQAPASPARMPLYVPSGRTIP